MTPRLFEDILLIGVKQYLIQTQVRHSLLLLIRLSLFDVAKNFNYMMIAVLF